MDVSTAIDLLADAELKQLAVKDDKNAVLGFINSGILEIYKRFNLWEEEAIVNMTTGVTTYLLDGTDVNVTMDLSDHEFLMVEAVYAEDGLLMTLNDEQDVYGASTPKYNRLEVFQETNGETLSVIYRAAPIFLTNEKASIGLPPQFNEALFNYVGYRGHGSVKGDIKSENNTHYMRFEQSCKRIKLEGLYNQDDLVAYKFEDRGFL